MCGTSVVVRPAKFKSLLWTWIPYPVIVGLEVVASLTDELPAWAIGTLFLLNLATVVVGFVLALFRRVRGNQVRYISPADVILFFNSWG
jgi:hypothetical protein